MTNRTTTEKIYLVVFNHELNRWECQLDAHTKLVAVPDRKVELLATLEKLGYHNVTENKELANEGN